MKRGIVFIGALLVAIWVLADRFAIRHVYAMPSVAAPLTEVPTPHARRRLLRMRSAARVAQLAISNMANDSGRNITTVAVPIPAPTDAELVELLNDTIRPGLDRSQLRERLGDPVLAAETVEQGTLYETYVYQHKPNGPVALAYLKDGRVTDDLKSWR